MTKLLIMTHGDFGASLLASAATILGEQKDCVTLALDPTFGAEGLKAAAQKQLDAWPGDVMIFVDMLGGTPWNVACPFVAENQKREVLSGLSLPLLLEALTLRDGLGARDLGIALQKLAGESVVRASHLLKGDGTL